MYSDEEIVGSFTNFIVRLIINASKDYKKSLYKHRFKEIAMSNELVTKVSLSIIDDGTFSISEKDISYNKLENFLENEEYYKAMKQLSNRQKQILYLSVVKDLSVNEISKIIGITENNVSKTKTLAIKTFLKNYRGYRDGKNN